MATEFLFAMICLFSVRRDLSLSTNDNSRLVDVMLKPAYDSDFSLIRDRSPCSQVEARLEAVDGIKMKITSRVRLRRLVSSDFAAYFDMKCDPVDIKVSGHSRPPDKRALRRWIAEETCKPETHLLVAEDTIKSAIVGYIFIRRSQESEHEVELSYGVAPNYRGNRMGQQILREAAHFTRTHMQRVRYAVCWVSSLNQASINSVMAAGYRDSGIQKNQLFNQPTEHVQVMNKYVLAI